jgi:hypothetical protein
MGEFQLDFFRTRQSKGSPKVSNHSKLIDTAGATLVQARSYRSHCSFQMSESAEALRRFVILQECEQARAPAQKEFSENVEIVLNGLQPLKGS